MTRRRRRFAAISRSPAATPRIGAHQVDDQGDGVGALLMSGVPESHQPALDQSL